MTSLSFVCFGVHRLVISIIVYVPQDKNNTYLVCDICTLPVCVDPLFSNKQPSYVPQDRNNTYLVCDSCTLPVCVDPLFSNKQPSDVPQDKNNTYLVCNSCTLPVCVDPLFSNKHHMFHKTKITHTLLEIAVLSWQYCSTQTSLKFS